MNLLLNSDKLAHSSRQSFHQKVSNFHIHKLVKMLLASGLSSRQNMIILKSFLQLQYFSKIYFLFLSAANFLGNICQLNDLSTELSCFMTPFAIQHWRRTTLLPSFPQSISGKRDRRQWNRAADVGGALGGQLTLEYFSKSVEIH